MPTSRRSFLGTAAAGAAAGFPIGTPYVAGASSRPGPNDTISIGLIGCGGRGRHVMRQHMAVEGVQVVAVCDTPWTLDV